MTTEEADGYGVDKGARALSPLVTVEFKFIVVARRGPWLEMMELHWYRSATTCEVSLSRLVAGEERGSGVEVRVVTLWMDLDEGGFDGGAGLSPWLSGGTELFRQ